MAKDTLPDTQVYLDALARSEKQVWDNPNHSENCSFEAFKSAADCIVETLSKRNTF